LIKYYGAEKGDETLKFFEVHRSADIIHRQVIKQLLGDVCDSDLKKEETLEAIDLALSSLNNFLSGIERVYC
jgi:pyrroloquinoline quinone (PQQ) biosynthesis protein C